MNKIKILVAMSGGVDSSATASRLLEEGFYVEGVTLNFGKFCSKLTIEDAKNVAKQLGIKHYIIDCESNFENKVIKYFAEDYINGKTPNPCVKCNREVKFYELLKLREQVGADFLATGHYAKITNYNNEYWLEKADDLKKDQSYFLGQLKYEYLKYIKFPLSEITKEDVRKYAKKLNLVVAEKKESQDICFTQNKNYKDIIKDYYSTNEGNIVDIETNKILAKHTGIINYTQGQRKGLNIGGSSEPLFVINIDSLTNTIFVGKEKYLYKNTLKINNVNFLDLNLEFEKEYIFDVKLRSTNNVNKSKIIFHKDFTADLELLEESRNITKGQVCVVYFKNRVLASGYII